MSDRIQEFIVTTPAGTPVATPQRAAMTMDPCQIDEISVLVPPGPSGELGFAFAVRNDQQIPAGAPSWIVTDDERLNISLDDLPTSGDWYLVSYNTGIYPHTVYVRFKVTSIALLPAPAALPPDLIGLSGVAAPAGKS